MQIAKKELWFGIAGLGMLLAGVVWFILSIQGVLDGMAMMMGYFLGAGLALCGLIVAFVYFFRRGKILRLVSGKNLLARWMDGESAVYLASDCAYMDGELHLWSGPGARLEKVSIQEKQMYSSSASFLEVDYANSAQVRDVITGIFTTVWKARKFSARIPADQLDMVRAAAEKLQGKAAGKEQALGQQKSLMDQKAKND